MKSYYVTVAVLAGFAIAGMPTAQAAEDGAAPKAPQAQNRPAPGQIIKQADANGDGMVSLEEIHAKMPRFPAERFAALDKNSDGLLEMKEFQGAGGEAMERMRAADKDQDRRVSKEEFSAQFPEAPENRFAMLDKNSDGFLDRKDRDGQAAPAPQKPRDKAAGENPAKDASVYLEKLVRNHDTDADGRVTLAELDSAKHGFPKMVFGALDRDGDGALTAADATAKPAKAKPAEKPAKKAPEKKKAKPEDAKKMEGQKKRPNLDVNKDGTITFEEAQSVYPNYTREQFNKRDKNSDGVINKADRAQS